MISTRARWKKNTTEEAWNLAVLFSCYLLFSLKNNTAQNIPKKTIFMQNFESTPTTKECLHVRDRKVGK